MAPCDKCKVSYVYRIESMRRKHSCILSRDRRHQLWLMLHPTTWTNCWLYYSATGHKLPTLWALKTPTSHVCIASILAGYHKEFLFYPSRNYHNISNPATHPNKHFSSSHLIGPVTILPHTHRVTVDQSPSMLMHGWVNTGNLMQQAITPPIWALKILPNRILDFKLL